jgi:F-type H+-transporting ATPase subunit c
MSSPFSPASISTKRFIFTTTTEKGKIVMDVHAAQMIGAGIACIALVGAGIGIGNVFGSYLSGALRNPGAAATQTTNLLLGFALCEATGLFGLVIALLILFAF